MDFSQIFLGYREINDFINLSVREGFIKSYQEDFKSEFLNDINPKQSIRINNKTSLLRILLLYDKIDSNRLITYDLSKLIDYGLISDKSIINSHGKGDSKSYGITNPEFAVLEKLMLDDSEELFFLPFVKGLFLDVDNRFGINSFDEIEEDFFIKISKALSLKDIKRVNVLFLQYNIVEIIADEILESIYERTCVEQFRPYLAYTYNEQIKFSKKQARIIIEKYINIFCEKK